MTHTDLPAVLVLSTADWDRPLWTNKQHLASRLHGRIGELYYVNSMGLRRPTVHMRDLRRVGGKVLANTRRQTSRSAVAPPPGLRVLQPVVVPWHRPGPVASLNRALLERTVAVWLEQPAHKRVLWSFSPVTYGLHRHAAFTVYHCVDLLAEIPGYDPVAISHGEATLAHAGARAIASSREVQRHLERVGFTEVLLWENVADVEMIAAESQVQKRRADHVVFAGNLTALKVDFTLLGRLVEEVPRVHLELAGPLGEGGGAAPPTGLLNAPRVHYHGTLSPPDMARLFGRCSVGLVPYLVNPYTTGVFPMKLFEYLAGGLAVVSTALPSLPEFAHVDRCESTDAFIAAVDRNAALPAADVEDDRVRSARAHSWERRGAEAFDLITTRLEVS